MPRTVPIPPPPLKAPALETWTLRLRTITPMFGGSATPRQVDPEHPVRAASVRGHLRFWWRATAGAQYATPGELFKAEEAIWGSVQQYGKVAIKVYVTSTGDKKPCAVFPEGKTFPNFGPYPGYALFPFQGKAKKDRRTGTVNIIEPPANCIVGVEFTLKLSFPEELNPQIRDAVSAWVKFGGIGARTRRGCGSIELVGDELNSTETRRLHNNLLTLAPLKVFVGESNSDAVAAWKESVELYKEFRQGKGFARDPGSDPSRPAKLGRSRYPEPDTIRALFPSERWTHNVRHAVSGFPRADLGLPIVFHFQEEGPEDDFILESASASGTRFASPIITKAIDLNGQYVPAIIFLDAPHVWEAGNLAIRLAEEKKGVSQEVSKEQVNLSAEQRQNIPPLQMMGALPIREALIEFVKSEGFKEVRL